MIIPSIDLMDGKAVQLKQGKDKMLERDNPLELAKYFNRFGEIAVIDLDAAMGKGDNKKIIAQICQIADCRIGGGIFNIETAKKIISIGASKIIIGSKAFEDDKINHKFLAELKEAVGRQQIIIAIDAYEQEIVTKAWKHKTGLNLFDVVEELDKYASEFLFTCVEKEGGLQGTDIKTVKELLHKTTRKITLAGGITTLDEIKIIAELDVHAQLGMAIYTGKLNLEEAFTKSLNWKTDLLPTITCDTDGQVLMLAYSNPQSIKRTFETGKICPKGDFPGFFSEPAAVSCVYFDVIYLTPSLTAQENCLSPEVIPVVTYKDTIIDLHDHIDDYSFFCGRDTQGPG